MGRYDDVNADAKGWSSQTAVSVKCLSFGVFERYARNVKHSGETFEQVTLGPPLVFFFPHVEIKIARRRFNDTKHNYTEAPGRQG